MARNWNIKVLAVWAVVEDRKVEKEENDADAIRLGLIKATEMGWNHIRV